MAGKHFSDSELECHCFRCKSQHTADKVSTLFVQRLDCLREIVGKPINVSDCYRCPDHNREVGGSPNSQHLAGLAADIYVGDPYDFSAAARKEYADFYQAVLNSKLFDGVGCYPNGLFVHVDMRDGGIHPNKYRWEE